MSNLTAIIDADGILYKCASSGEKRTIVATHKNTKEQWAADNRTAFWELKLLRMKVCWLRLIRAGIALLCGMSLR